MFYTVTILGLAVLTSIFVFLRIMLLVCATLKASKSLHNRLIENVMSAPINLFFDVTPIGKILNRFSRDLQMLDESIVFSIGTFLSCIYQAAAALAVAVYAVHYIVFVEIIFLVVVVYLFKKTLPAYKESYRINMIQFSPIISFF
jgi:ATP-binding cassette subfamily C (CFTR/MRP) protein 1